MEGHLTRLVKIIYCDRDDTKKLCNSVCLMFPYILRVLKESIVHHFSLCLFNEVYVEGEDPLSVLKIICCRLL